MIVITATAESVSQARALLEAGIDRIYIGESDFGLRLPHPFTREEIKEVTDYAHLAGKSVSVAVNGIFHPEKMKQLPEYLDYLESISVDYVVVGDTGAIYLLTKDDRYSLPIIYDAATLVTNSRQINFWAKNGVKEAVLAREVPFEEMKAMQEQLMIPAEVLVYGATAIHQSKRPLLQNYYNFIHSDEEKGKDRELYLAEPKEKDTHYSIFEDNHGTHIFANNDLDLMLKLGELNDAGYTHWKLDGIYTSGDAFVEIAKLFVEAKKEIQANTWNLSKATLLDEKLRALHPTHRGLDEGFFNLDPKAIV